MKVGLIAGSARKLSEKATVEKFYSISPLFRGGLEYSKRYYDAVYVLSPKHGILALTDEIEPYEANLANIQRRALKEWLNKVINQIKIVIPEGAEIYFHAGNRYRKLIPLLNGKYQCYEPLKGLAIGKQLRWYKEKLS